MSNQSIKLPDDIYNFNFEKRKSDGGLLFKKRNSEFDNKSIKMIL